MRSLFLCLTVCSAVAVTLDVPKLPPPAFADGERSGDFALPTNRAEKLRLFRVELAFEGTPSNNVQVTFGRDSLPADGKLAAEETDFILGWDCGEWFLRPQGLMERHVFIDEKLPQTGRHALSLEIPVDANGMAQSAVFKDGARVFTFPELKLSPFPDWLQPTLWSHLRVTVRGKGNADEKVRVLFSQENEGKRITK